jgi:hypothetical protein
MIFFKAKTDDQRQPAPPATQLPSAALSTAPAEKAAHAHPEPDAIWASRSKRIASEFLNHVRQQQSVPSQARQSS